MIASRKGKGVGSGPNAMMPPVVQRRHVSNDVQRLLFVRAGGRCEFNGCNKYLLRHHLTRSDGNFADMAHIVAFSDSGPRGRMPRPSGIHDPENLMLLCHDCHKLIDDDPGRYSVAILKGYKRCHEERIFHVTGLGPDLETTVVQLKANIGGQAVDIPVAHVTEAVAPRYPTDPRGYVIDLTGINGEDETYYRTATREIRRQLERIYEPGMDVEKTRHISLFALAPIPLLVYLGSRLSNKIPVDPYQRHRDTENWMWKRIGTPVGYEFRLLRTGRDKKKVALVLSLSGTVHVEDLPKQIDAGFHIYGVTLVKQTPNPCFLNLREDLVRFKEVYLKSLRSIYDEHGAMKEIHLFPAVPAPVAILCGRELLPKVDPELVVYDYNGAKGGFSLALRIERSSES